MALDLCLRKRATLEKAWQKVYENGIKAESEITRKGVLDFKKKETTNLKRIGDQLRDGRYKFQKALGVEIEKDNGQLRPLVIPHLHDRIVHRALLDVLWEHEAIHSYVSNERSFGGLPGKSVSMALAETHKLIQEGNSYYFRSDIKAFFTKIPTQRVLSQVFDLLSPDITINKLLKSAAKLELENLERLKNKHLFPDHDIGTPQGSSLSPFFGNILLKDFDDVMNSNDIHCIRFIDDFLILTKTKNHLNEAIATAKKQLSAYKLEIYDPSTGDNKAERGRVKDKIDFLGCVISEDEIAPNQKSFERLVGNIRAIVASGVQQIYKFKKNKIREHSYLSTLGKINNSLLGWGNHYKFCNSLSKFEELDRIVDKEIGKLSRVFYKEQKALKNKPNEHRRILGVHLLIDSKSHPIIK